MKAIHDYIVEVEDRYNNKVDVEGSELIVNTEISENDYHFVNRIGTVRGVPRVGTNEILEGSRVLVHHNVFRRWHDQRGKERNCRAYIRDGLYTVQPEQIFAYEEKGSWRPCEGFSFIRPIYQNGEWDTHGASGSSGVVVYSDAFRNGSIVGYKPGMDVEFDIDGEKLYRILNKFINVEFKEKDKEAYRIF